MTRIDDRRLGLELLPPQRAGQGQAGTTTRSQGVGSPDADRVRLSPDLTLAASAIAAAGSASEIRPEAVERARALLATGELGANAERLADALIDHVLGSQELPGPWTR